MAADLGAEVAHYERLIKDAGGIDLQLLGIGEDGHIGFNEPLSALMSRTREKALTPKTRRQNAAMFGGDPDRVPKRALTMGVGTILEAREIILLATGAAKAAILAKAVEGPITAMISASAIQLHPRCKVVAGRGRRERAEPEGILRLDFSERAGVGSLPIVREGGSANLRERSLRHHDAQKPNLQPRGMVATRTVRAIHGFVGSARARDEPASSDPLAAEPQGEVFRKHVDQDCGHAHRDPEPEPRRMMDVSPVSPRTAGHRPFRSRRRRIGLQEGIGLRQSERAVFQGPFPLDFVQMRIAGAGVDQNSERMRGGLVVAHADPEHEPALRQLFAHTVDMTMCDHAREQASQTRLRPRRGR